MSNLYESLSGDGLGPFQSSTLFALRMTTALIMSKACHEVFELEHDVEKGLDDLNLPPEVRAQVMVDYRMIKERWNLLLASPICVD